MQSGCYGRYFRAETSGRIAAPERRAVSRPRERQFGRGLSHESRLKRVGPSFDGRGLPIRAPRNDWLNEYIHPDDQPRVLQTIRDAVRTRNPFQLEHRVSPSGRNAGLDLLASGSLTQWKRRDPGVVRGRQRHNCSQRCRGQFPQTGPNARCRSAGLHARTGGAIQPSSRCFSWRLLRNQDQERRHIARIARQRWSDIDCT